MPKIFEVSPASAMPWTLQPSIFLATMVVDDESSCDASVRGMSSIMGFRGEAIAREAIMKRINDGVRRAILPFCYFDD